MFTITWIDFAGVQQNVGAKVAWEKDEATKLVSKMAEAISLRPHKDVVRDFKEWLTTLDEEDSSWAYKETGDRGDEDDEDYEEDIYLTKGLYCSYHHVGS